MPSTERRPDWLPGEIGIWIFIFLDLAVFAIFFLCIVYAWLTERDSFMAGHEYLSTFPALINTIVLLTGSLCVVRGVHAIRDREHQTWRGAWFLQMAVACGLVFIVVKAIEYEHLFGAGITINTSPFFMCYLGFTMIHLVHVIIGTCVLITISARVRRGRASTSSVESAALYWHMVDLLWLVLFPLLYLI